jgi:hypothetical protein
MCEYIYLIQEREFIKTKENIYKIGKTKQENLKRFNSYPKGSNLLLYSICSNCNKIENELIKLFKEKYILQRDIGNEYFKGNHYEMMKDINDIIFNYKEDEDENKEEKKIEEIAIIPEKDFTEKKYKCDKCNKSYNKLDFYKNHVKNCNISSPIDKLTCPKCMKVFYSKDSKNRHIRNGKCTPCSINNHIANTTITNLYNNYSNERIDYITLEKFYEIIFTPLPICEYTFEKHFNKDFTENNNIKYSGKNKYYVKENNKWCIKNIDTFLKLHIDKIAIEIRNKISANFDYINNKLNDDMKIYKLNDYLNNMHFTNRYYKDNIETIKDYIKNSPELEKDTL